MKHFEGAKKEAYKSLVFNLITVVKNFFGSLRIPASPRVSISMRSFTRPSLRNLSSSRTMEMYLALSSFFSSAMAVSVSTTGQGEKLIGNYCVSGNSPAVTSMIMLATSGCVAISSPRHSTAVSDLIWRIFIKVRS